MNRDSTLRAQGYVWKIYGNNPLRISYYNKFFLFCSLVLVLFYGMGCWLMRWFMLERIGNRIELEAREAKDIHRGGVGGGGRRRGTDGQ